MTEPLRLGVIGLGRAFTLMLPTLTRYPRIQLVAAADPRKDARDRFAAEFNGRAYETPGQLCADGSVQAIYIASPHQYHVEHVQIAAYWAKHVLVEKPMALTIADAQAMIQATSEAGVRLVVGHSHSFDLPYLRTRELIGSAAFGRLRMITALNFTDFMYRPRRPEELDTSAGGGVVFSQAAHQVDVVRLLAGSKAETVRAFTGQFDPTRATEGAYQAIIRMAGGVSATLTYSGYGHFDSDELLGWVGEMGQPRDPSRYGEARSALQRLTSPEAETEMKHRRAYGPSGRDAFTVAENVAHNHFGFVLASCEHADLRPLPHGVQIYADNERRVEPITAPTVPRAEVLDELCAAVLDAKPPLHDGAWGLATLEICLAMLASAREANEIKLLHQI
jgi:phthalate 4,5-cis-dihydrodiol dehydrogenase